MNTGTTSVFADNIFNPTQQQIIKFFFFFFENQSRSKICKDSTWSMWLAAWVWVRAITTKRTALEHDTWTDRHKEITDPFPEFCGIMWIVKRRGRGENANFCRSFNIL